MKLNKIVIVGAGFAGLVCAIESKKDNNEVIILEKRDTVGKKILVTGNGRCNYFNDAQKDDYYHSDNLDFIKGIKDEANIVKEFYSNLGIVPYIKDGYYYPFSKDAKSIRNALIRRCEELNIEIITNYRVDNIIKNNDKFIINNDIECDKVVIATGSKAYYKDDEQSIGYDIAKKFGHNIIPTLPSLVQMNGVGNYFKEWAGVRSEAVVSLYVDDSLVKEEKGEVMLTDYGLSGICIFNLSSYATRSLHDNKKVRVDINFLPWLKDDLNKYLSNRNNRLEDVLNGMLNSKLVNLIIKKSNINKDDIFNNLKDSDKEVLVNNLIDFKVDITSVNGFDKAQVSTGGIDTREIEKDTMESKLVKNLYFVGEVVDVDGDCGGYNITFATLSGIKAGKSL